MKGSFGNDPFSGLFIFLVLSKLFIVAAVEYNTQASIVTGKLNVHFVPHSHNDLGWLKTIDQYFIGSHSEIQLASVKDIIDSVVQELEENPNRKYIQVEMGFFVRWWRQQTKAKKESVKKLIKTGQIEFINGGWCMHDEATTHYVDMIDQTTLGHRYLKNYFGIAPRHGWQIDSFGHSAVQGYLLGAEVGFESIYVARIDYQDRHQRYINKSLEMIWRGSHSLGSSAEIFMVVFPIHYNPPQSFEFELSSPDYTPIQDDPSMEEYNVQVRVRALIKAAEKQAALTRTNHIMWTMGDDFTYSSASTWFQNMDKLIHYTNLDGRINALYSNPSIYLNAKHLANETWPLKIGDFFPYADDKESYWSGYFTSRPAFKRFVRNLSGYLQAARQLEFLVGRNKFGFNTCALEEAMANAQHHDGISGTEKEAVANDYIKNLHIGTSKAEAIINSAFACLIMSKGKPGSYGCIGSETPLKFDQCQNLNITYCHATEASMKNGSNLVLIAYNSLAWPRHEFIRIPVSRDDVAVTDSEGKIIVSQITLPNEHAKRARTFYAEVELGVSLDDGPLYWLIFEASIPPFGFTSFFIGPSHVGVAIHSTTVSDSNAVKVGNGKLELDFSSTGQLERIVNIKSGIELCVSQSNLWYNGNLGDDGQASGAYIFRPISDIPYNIRNDSTPVRTTIVRGPLVIEVHQMISPWMTQVFRLYKDEEHIEVEFMIGPIPVHDLTSKEVITQFSTNIKSKKIFYTDSNGRDFIKRIRDHRDDWSLKVFQPISSNYYPINLGLYITDNTTDFSLLVDRAVGGASLADGQVEIMLHRRLLADDNRGVDEPLYEEICLNETTCEGRTIQGTYYISAKPKEDATIWRRTQGQRLLAPIILAIAKQEKKESPIHIPQFSAMPKNYSLPANVALITLQELGNGFVLLRLAHLYEITEHPKYSKIASVDLRNLVNGRKILQAIEMNLSANQAKVDTKKRQWNVDKEKTNMDVPLRGRAFDSISLIVELGPMEIRTFKLKVEF